MFGLESLAPIAIKIFGGPAFCGLWIFGAVASSTAFLLREEYKENTTNYMDIRPRLDSSRTRIVENDNERSKGAIGSSGSTCAITSALACLRPYLRGQTFGVPLNMQLWEVEALFAGFSGFCVFTRAFPIWDHAGHLGGIAAGVISYMAFVVVKAGRTVRVKY